MTQNSDIRIPCHSFSEINLMVKKLRYVKAHNRPIGEDEIRQRIEIEFAFQARLAAAFDKEGCFVEDVKPPDEREEASNRKEHEHDPDRTLLSWRCFRVHSKDAPFWLTVWLSGDKSSLPQSFRYWRTLGGDDMSVSGPSKTKEWRGVSFSADTMPLCCHLSIIDERLRFETLPLPVMRDTLLGGHLAEELASKVAVAFDRIRAITADREKALPVAEDTGLAQTLAPHSADCERRPAVLSDDGRAAAREAEIRQKIEIEIVFRARLAAALDREGYIIKGVMTPENEGREFLREKYENEPDRSKKPCVFFFVHSKKASASFCLGVWFSSVEPSPQSFNWRALADVIGAGPSKSKERDRVSLRDATQPVCYLISISDARLRFEALPSPVMQATLLDSQLAEELAAKVAVAFDRICHHIEKHAKGPVGFSGLPSGFPKLDDKLKGLKPAEVIVLASRPSMGKTALTLNIAKCVALGRDINGSPMKGGHDRQHAVAVFSLESSTEALAARLHCGISGVATGHGKAPVFVDDTGSVDISDLCDRARCMKMRHKIELIIIDYLQLCNFSAFSKQGRLIETAQIAKQIKAIAKELNIPVIVLSQICRGCELRGDKSQTPSRAALCDACGIIVQDADAVLFLSRPGRASGLPGREGEAFITVDVVKNANGPTGEVRLDLDGEVIRSCDRDVRDHKDTDGIESATIDKASKESVESYNEIVLIAF